MRERRQPGPEVGDDSLGDAPESDRLAARRAADALESFGHALEPIGIRLKMTDELATRRTRILAQIINPTRETHERGTELMSRLARHRHP